MAVRHNKAIGKQQRRFSYFCRPITIGWLHFFGSLHSRISASQCCFKSATTTCADAALLLETADGVSPDTNRTAPSGRGTGVTDCECALRLISESAMTIKSRLWLPIKATLPIGASNRETRKNSFSSNMRSRSGSLLGDASSGFAPTCANSFLGKRNNVKNA